jgi:hypothetical protein
MVDVGARTVNPSQIADFAAAPAAVPSTNKPNREESDDRFPIPHPYRLQPGSWPWSHYAGRLPTELTRRHRRRLIRRALARQESGR